MKGELQQIQLLLLVVHFHQQLVQQLLHQQQLQGLVNEKMAELERCRFQAQSLERCEREQKALIEKLSNNET